MKKIKLEFQKEILSTLSGNELLKLRGGMDNSYYDQCPTEDYECVESGNCDTWQFECTIEPVSKDCESEKCVGPKPPTDGPVISCGCATFDCKTIVIACYVQ